MNKLLIILLFIPLISIGQNTSKEDLILQATESWVYIEDGNPIDGFTRSSMRLNNEVEESFFLIKIVNTSDTNKIKNASGKGSGDRDDVYVRLQSSDDFCDGLDEILMYFDNDKVFYKVNFTCNSNGILWMNATSSKEDKFISRFIFIDMLKHNNEVNFRLKYLDKRKENISFSLNGSSNAINQLLDLTEIVKYDDDDFTLESIRGILGLSMLGYNELFTSDLSLINKSSSEVISSVDLYLSDKLGSYYSAFTRFDYEIMIKKYTLTDNYGYDHQALRDSYELFKQKGYTKSFGEYIDLMSTNLMALNDSYSLYSEPQSNGTLFSQPIYTGTIEDFSTLIGVSYDHYLNVYDLNDKLLYSIDIFKDLDY